jgi:methionyl-tRNA synthetase
MSVETLYKKSTYYLTTPLYYVNDVPHIGHAYCTIAADVLARYKRLRGHKVHFLTGTDEHGQKIEKAAEKNNETPQQLADRVVERFKALWTTLNISNDDFIRTTEERHKHVVKQFFKLVYDKGDIYLGEYEGLYCQPCESYYTESQLVDGKCPSCSRAVELLKEESYFFRLSRYQEVIIDYIKANPQWIQPEFRRNEILGMLREPLTDLSITRTTTTWGVKIPDLGNDVRGKDGELKKSLKDHYIYVWFDALLNYVTAIDYLSDAGKFLEH